MVDIQEQDQWISYLSECKQLSENDIKRLCEKVRIESTAQPILLTELWSVSYTHLTLPTKRIV